MRGIPTGTAGNKRVYEKRVDGSTQEWFHYFGITGQRLARYSFTVSGAVITFAEHENSVWFGGKLVKNAGSWMNEDRLGSVGKYLPYGEDKPGASNPANDSVKFATYTRDAGTGIDYADQRWHAQGVGRFLTGDPYQASAGPGDPGSWNRYGYAIGDATNFNDPKGLAYCNVPGRWTFYRDDMERHVELVEIHCTSLAGSVFDRGVYEFQDVAQEHQVSQAMTFLEARVESSELANFNAARFASMGRLTNVSDDCLRAVGASRKDFEDRLYYGLRYEFRDYGPLTVVASGTEGDLTPVPNSTDPTRLWPIARWSSDGFVRFNRRINWSAPNNSFAVNQFGGVRTYDLPFGMSRRVGASAMSNDQFIDLVLLHELAHSFGNSHPMGVSDTYDSILWRACFN